jgi:hypothetical protein
MVVSQSFILKIPSPLNSQVTITMLIFYYADTENKRVVHNTEGGIEEILEVMILVSRFRSYMIGF